MTEIGALICRYSVFKVRAAFCSRLRSVSSSVAETVVLCLL
jgi:hypothetical protein